MRDMTADEIKTYAQDGIVCLRGMFSADWVNKLRAAAERSMQNPGDLHVELAAERQEAGRFFHDTFVWRYNETCRSCVYDSPAAQIANQLMGATRTNIFFDQWLIKEPGSETKTPWHQDMTYWPIDGTQISTLWLALDPVDKENGAVEYVKGSHLWQRKFKPVSFGGGNQYKEELPEVPDIEAMRDDLEFISFDMQPGDCTLHNGLTIHGSPGNLSLDQRRRAWVSRWAGDDVVYKPREGLQEMPPIPPGLKSGDPLDSDLWPRIIG